MALDIKDRVPTRPGRIKLTAEDGTSQYYTMERADEPSQEGTAINKSLLDDMCKAENTLVSDAVAALLGGGITDTNGAILQLLNKVNGLKKYVIGSYTGTGTYGASDPNSLTFDYPINMIWVFAISKSNSLQTLGFGSSVPLNVIPVSKLPTTYTQYFGLLGAGNNNYFSYTYGKRSPDKKTVYWYSTNSSYLQINESNYIYHYIAFE